MLNITKNLDHKTLTVALEGRLDTTTAPQLEAELKSDIADVTLLIMDFEKLDYISSAGLRVLLQAFRSMKMGGVMRITNANPITKKVFDVTGFSSIFTFE